MAKIYDKIIQSQTEPSTQSLWLNKGTLKYHDGTWHIIGDFQHGNMMEQVNTNVQKVQATANEAKTKAESAQSSISDLTTVVEGISNTLDTTTTTATEAKQKAESNASSITGFNQVATNIRNDLSTLQTTVSNIQTSLTDVSTTANQAQSTASGAENLAQTNQTAITELGEAIDANKNVIDEMFSKGVAPIEIGIFESESSPSVLEITDKDKIHDIINASVISYSVNSADFTGIYFAHPFHRTNNGNMSENVITFFTTALNLNSLAVLKVRVEPNNTSASAILYT